VGDFPLFNWMEDDGFVNRPASKQRAKREAQDGTRSQRHKKIAKLLDWSGAEGATWKQLGETLGLHHGQISGALSNMHKNGEVFTLVEQRDRCHPYVHIKYRDCYDPSQRFDEPVKTASVLRQEELELWKQVAQDLAEALYSDSNKIVALMKYEELRNNGYA
jgi:hypothetical protein